MNKRNYCHLVTVKRTGIVFILGLVLMPLENVAFGQPYSLSCL
jgi:hypothetical protein